MLLLLSNELCLSTDTLSDAVHFTNRLAYPLINSPPTYKLRVCGLAVYPWPKKPFIVLSNICENSQPTGGKKFTRALTMAYGKEKFTTPDVLMVPGYIEGEIEIKLESLDGEKIEADTVAVQILIVE